MVRAQWSYNNLQVSQLPLNAVPSTIRFVKSFLRICLISATIRSTTALKNKMENLVTRTYGVNQFKPTQ